MKKKQALQPNGRPWKHVAMMLSDLRINSERQREIEEPKVEWIIKNFDWTQVNRIKVCRIVKSGIFAVCDGQHTATAILRKFGNMLVDCEHIEVADENEFAQMVKKCNPKISTKPTKRNYFWMDTAGREPYTVDIHQVARENGFTVVKTATCAQHINCVDTLMRLHKADGEALRHTLSFARDAFAGHRLHDYVLEGIYIFLTCCSGDPALRIPKVTQALRNVPFASLLRQATDGAKAPGVTKARAFARVLKATYNEQTGKGGRHIRTDIP